MTRARTTAAQRPPGAHNPARELAVHVLTQVLHGGAFAAPTLDAALRAAELPPRDAGLATHVVYGTLRHLPSLEAALSPLLREATAPKVHTLLLAGAYEKLHLGTPPHAVVSDYVNLARRARLAPSGLVNAVLRRVEAVPSPRSELSGWLEDAYRAAYGERADAIFADLLRPQPLWLSLSEEGVRLLQGEGSEVTPGPQGVDRVELRVPLRQSAAFRAGQAQPINPASLACVDALGEVDGLTVYDLAGGAGIKAAMLAARGADATSVDLQGRKHALARENLRRLGLSARMLTHDLTRPVPYLPPAPRVLLDAPCTGSGTLRSHPEIKRRLTPEVVTELAELQGRLLPNAAALVAPGGVLVYSVCSVLPQEGAEVVTAFLATHPDFTAEPVPDLDLPHVPSGPGVLTVPDAGIDGFFIARLSRQT